MGPVELEVGPQSNPVTRAQGGAAAGPPQQNAANSPGAPAERVTAVPLLKAAIDWAVKQNGDSTSRFNNKLDLNRIVVMGHSCGGGLAVQLAAEDPRVTGLGIWYSGAGLVGARGNDPASLQKIKGPILLITGDEQHDIAFGSGKSTFEAITHTPIFYGWQDDLQHIGTFGARNGGDNGAIARQLARVDDAQRSEPRPGCSKGPAATLRKDPTWHIQKKKIDDRPATRTR